VGRKPKKLKAEETMSGAMMLAKNEALNEMAVCGNCKHIDRNTSKMVAVRDMLKESRVCACRRYPQIVWKEINEYCGEYAKGV